MNPANLHCGCTSYYVGCDCFEVEHTIALMKFDDEPFVTVNVVLTEHRILWRRLRVVWQYLRHKRGYLTETVLNPSQVRYMRDVLDEFCRDNPTEQPSESPETAL